MWDRRKKSKDGFMKFPMRLRLLACGILLAGPLLISCGLANPAGGETPTPPVTPSATPEAPPTMNNLIPKPSFVQTAPGGFSLTAAAGIYVSAGNLELESIGNLLAQSLRPATGFALPVIPSDSIPPAGNIYLAIEGGDPVLGEEGYTLAVTPDLVALVAYMPAGLFRGAQTVRQLLAAGIESPAVQPGPWVLPAGAIRDLPRFSWRGAMLDVARHFFGVADVKAFIDWMAYYKMNRFHLHLSDDQGWRLMIDSWPQLAQTGGSTAVGGDPGGFYTPAEYAEIVAYAQSRYITVIPEIDMPGHTNAALASYPDLNCDGVARPPNTGIEVGFSTLCVGKDITYTFIDDVIREIAALTPGPYIHIGGDEVRTLSAEEYLSFVQKAQGVVNKYGKRMIGWDEIGRIDLLPQTIVQYWNGPLAAEAARQGAKIIMSPASRAYLDQKYTSSTELGLNWAGNIEVQDSYSWEPAAQLDGVSEGQILGVEAPLWTETIRTRADIEYMALPRLIGIAEIGWSSADGRDWNEYRLRLAEHGLRLTFWNVNFYRSPQVPWK
jgi:hexosaminidase